MCVHWTDTGFRSCSTHLKVAAWRHILGRSRASIRSSAAGQPPRAVCKEEICCSRRRALILPQSKTRQRRLVVTHVSLGIKCHHGPAFLHLESHSKAECGALSVLKAGYTHDSESLDSTGSGPCHGTANSCRKSANLQRAALDDHVLC